MATELGHGYVTLIPSARGFRRKAEQELEKPLRDVGRDGGEALTEGLEEGADTKGAAQRIANDLRQRTTAPMRAAGQDAGRRLTEGLADGADTTAVTDKLTRDTAQITQPMRRAGQDAGRGLGDGLADGAGPGMARLGRDAEESARRVGDAFDQPVAQGLTDEMRRAREAVNGWHRDTAGRLRDARGRFVTTAEAARRLGDETNRAPTRGRSAWAAFAVQLRQVGDGMTRSSNAARTLQRNVNEIGKPLRGLGTGLVLAQALIAAAAAAGALTAALAPAVALAAALPGLLAGAATSAVVAIAGFRGIGSAVTAMGKAQTGAGSSAASMARQQEAAAERVRSALMSVQRAQTSLSRTRESAAEAVAAAARRIADAQTNLARTEESAARRIADAQRRVADAARNVARVRQSAADSIRAAAERVRDAEERLADVQRDAARAQQDLNDARKEAVDRLRDLQREVAGAYLDERDAALSVEEALQRLQETRANPTADRLERDRAQLSYEQAVARLDDTRRRIDEQKRELAEAQAAGIEGDDRVVAARERVADANRAVQDAVKDVADAQRDAAKAQQQANEDIADAQRALADAQADLAQAHKDAAQDIADAQQAVKDAQEEAARVQRDAARDIADALAAVAEAQRDAARAQRDAALASAGAAGGVNQLAEAMANLSPAGQRFAKFLHAEVLPALKQLRFAAQEGLLPGVQAGIEAMLPLLPTLERGVTQNAEALGRVAKAGGEMVATWGDDISLLMETNARNTETFGMAALALGDALRHVMVAAAPLTERIAAGVLRFAEWAQRAAEAGRESGRLAAFFERAEQVAAQLWRIVSNLGQGLMGLGRAAAPFAQGLLDTLERLATRFNEFVNSAEGQEGLRDFFQRLTDLLPKVERFAESVGRLFFELGKSGALTDALGGFIDFLTGAVRWLTRLVQQHPGLVRFVAQLALFAAVARLLRLGALVTSITRLGNVLGGALSNATRFVNGIRGVAGAANTVAGRVGVAVGKIGAALGGMAARAAAATGRVVAQIAVQGARWVWLGVQALLHAAKVAAAWLIALGPIGIIIAVVIAAVALIIANWDKITAFVQEWGPKVWGWITSTFTSIRDTVIATVQGWVVGIQMHISAARQWLENTFTSIKDGWIARWQETRASVTATVGGWVADVRARIDGVRQWLATTWQNIREGAVTRWQELRQGVVATVQGWVADVQQRINNARQWLSDAWNTIRQTAVTAWNNLRTAVVNTITAVVNDARALPGRLRTAVGNLGNLLYNAGRDVVNGLWRGIQSLAGWVWNQVTNFINTYITGPVKRALNLGSPSKVMAEIGRDTARGLAMGMTAEERLVERAAERLAAAAIVEPDLAALSLAADRQAAANLSRIAQANSGALLGGSRTPVTGGSTAVTVNAITNANPREIAREVSWDLATSSGVR